MNDTAYDVFLNGRMVATCYDWFTADVLAFGYRGQKLSNKVDVHTRETGSNSFWHTGEPTDTDAFYYIRLNYKTDVDEWCLFKYDIERKEFYFEGDLDYWHIDLSDVEKWHKMPKKEEK